MAGPRPVLLVKNPSPFPHGLCKEGKFCDTGGHQLVAHGPKLAHRCILCHLPGFNKFKSTFQKIGIFHIQILGFWFYLDNQAVFFFFSVLGPCYFVRVFSSCSKQGLLFIAVGGLLISVASLVAEHRL